MRLFRESCRAAAAVLAALACRVRCDHPPSGSMATTPGLLPQAAAGKGLFFDTSRSASGKQSDATCHVPARAFTADPVTAHGLPVPLGGPQHGSAGFRNTPSLLYVALNQ